MWLIVIVLILIAWYLGYQYGLKSEDFDDNDPVVLLTIQPSMQPGGTIYVCDDKHAYSGDHSAPLSESQIWAASQLASYVKRTRSSDTCPYAHIHYVLSLPGIKTLQVGCADPVVYSWISTVAQALD